MSDIKNEIRNRVLGIEGEVDFRLPGCGIDASPVLQQCLPLDDAKQIEGGLSVADASHVESPVAAASHLDILDDVRTTEGSPVADDSHVESPVAAASHLDILDDVPTTDGSPVADDSHVESPVAAASHLDILDEVPIDDDLAVVEPPVAVASHLDILDEVPVDDDLVICRTRSGATDFESSKQYPIGSGATAAAVDARRRRGSVLDPKLSAGPHAVPPSSPHTTRSGATAAVDHKYDDASRRRGRVLDPKLSTGPHVDTPSSQHSTTTLGGPRRGLPLIIKQLISNPVAHSIPAHLEPTLSPSTDVVVADSGATDHMFPDKSAFVSYTPESSLRVKMGNNSFIPVHGRGTAVIALNGRLVLVRDALHVPGLRLPLYSLRAHLNQPGCCFIGLPATIDASSSMHVCFPDFALQVDLSRDCYLAYRPVGDTVEPSDLAYNHPSSSQVSAQPASTTTSSDSTPGPTLIPLDDDEDSAASDGGPALDAGPSHLPSDDDASRSSTDLQDGGPEVDEADPSLRLGAADTGPSSTEPLPDIPEMAQEWFCPSSTKHDPQSRLSKLSEDSASTKRPVLTPQDIENMKSQVKSMTRLLSSLSKSELIEKFHTDTTLVDSPSDPASKSKVRFLSQASPDEILKHIHRGGSFVKVRPCDKASPSDTKSKFSEAELHVLHGGRSWKNYRHITDVSKNGQLISTGADFPRSLGSEATLARPKRGPAIDPEKFAFLDYVHVDVAFGDCVSVGGYSYSLIFVDRATRYNWAFGLKNLSSASILSAFLKFKSAAGRFATEFRSDCDTKLFGTAVKEFLLKNESDIVGATEGRQSSNGLVESHWKTMVRMARAFLTEKQMPKTFWFFAIVEAARRMNTIPGKYRGKLASPFVLVHGEGQDARTWFPLFSICYFNHSKDNTPTGPVKRSKHQSQTMDGIAIGRSASNNGLMVYNPRTKKFYEAKGSYRLDSYRLPCSMYSSIKYDGGLFCSLLRDGNPPMEEKYPPGTRVERLDKSTMILRSGTVMDIPLTSAPTGDRQSDVRYSIQFDDGTYDSVPLSQMADIIPKPPVLTDEGPDSSGLPPFLQPGQKITYEQDGQYVKGYLALEDGVYYFGTKSHPLRRQFDTRTSIPNLRTQWADLCSQGILIPGHSAHSFLRTSAHASSSSTCDTFANLVSAVNLAKDCPASLMRALADSHPDREVWLQSYYEEKDGIESLGTFQRITAQQYRALREKGGPQALPSMCVLTIKRDENLMPLRAKSRIVVLGNHEERVWSKADKFAPVLRFDSLRFLTSLAVEKRRRLKQGDCKNAFCQGELPPEELTIIRPPPGDPDATKDEYWVLKKTLYGLRRSPRHWFLKIDGILKSMGLQPNRHDPCLYSGFLRDPSDPSAPISTVPITLGLYVDDFVYFSESDDVERRFERL